MNHSIHSADRTTHLKIIIMALMVAVSGVSVALSFRSSTDAGAIRTAAVVKAGKPVFTTSSGWLVIR
jgi:hypothetical protein